jgi:AraC family transcriptional regulator
VERYQLEAMRLPAHFHEHHLLILHQEGKGVVSRRQSGSVIEEDLFHLGDAGLYPSGEYGPIALDGPADVIHLHLDAEAMENRARQGLDLTHFALRDRFRFEDGLLLYLGRQLLAAASAVNTLGQLYVESLANTLSYHLIEHHATYQRRITGTCSRLPASVLARIDAYLETSCEQSVTLERG